MTFREGPEEVVDGVALAPGLLKLVNREVALRRFEALAWRNDVDVVRLDRDSSPYLRDWLSPEFSEALSPAEGCSWEPEADPAAFAWPVGVLELIDLKRKLMGLIAPPFE